MQHIFLYLLISCYVQIHHEAYISYGYIFRVLTMKKVLRGQDLVAKEAPSWSGLIEPNIFECLLSRLAENALLTVFYG